MSCLLCNQALIRRYPNGVTHLAMSQVLTVESIDSVEGSRGTETSKYPDEKKVITIP